MLDRLHVSRRTLVQALLLVAGAKPCLFDAVRSAHAMAQKPIIPGVQDFEGDVRLNGDPVHPGQLVVPGDVATTGPGASAVIVIGRNAFMLRENTRIEFYPVYFEEEGTVSGVLKVASGAMLSVFGKTKSTTIATPLATIGIRGTGCYVESRPDRTYACICYGLADLAAAGGGVLETVRTTHHDQPRYIFPPGAPVPIETAPVRDHRDAELRLLEALVHRRPPFDDDDVQRLDRY